jgi:putative glutamine amidotransferase
VAHDPLRDSTTLPLVEPALDAGVSLFALCRGTQELNVVFGGTLHQHVQEVDGALDHREDPSAPEGGRYEPAHEVRLAPGGQLAELFGRDLLQVNSLHEQAIDRLAPRLTVEATAPDGIVEAVRVQQARRFALGVQWHPEWEAESRPDSRTLFRAFAQSCRDRMRERLARGTASP